MNYPWYHNTISREACERLLVESSTDGAFLVRESESVSDAHILSMWYVFGHSLYTSIVCLTVPTGFKIKNKCVDMVSHYWEYAYEMHIKLPLRKYSLECYWIFCRIFQIP